MKKPIVAKAKIQIDLSGWSFGDELTSKIHGSPTMTISEGLMEIDFNPLLERAATAIAACGIIAFFEDGFVPYATRDGIELRQDSSDGPVIMTIPWKHVMLPISDYEEAAASVRQWLNEEVAELKAEEDGL